jgi:hypothetical protein
MKAILSYKLPEEEPEFRQAMNGQIYYNALWEIRELMYRLQKENLPIDIIQQEIRNILPKEIYE